MGEMIKEELNHKEYLTARLEEGELLDEDCVAAVGSEQDADHHAGIEGIIPISYGQLGNERILRYDINTYVSYMEYKCQIRQKETLCRIFLSILDTYALAESYLLEPAYFLLQQEYIYVDEANGKVWLILYPVYRQEKETSSIKTLRTQNFTKLFREMLKGVRLDREDMAFYGNLTYELDNMDSFHIVTFRKFLLEAVQEGEVSGEEISSSVSGSLKEERTGQEWVPEPEFQTGDVEVDVRISEPSLPVPPKKGKGILGRLLGRKDEKSGGKQAESGMEGERGSRKSSSIRLPDDEELPEKFSLAGSGNQSELLDSEKQKKGDNRGKIDKKEQARLRQEKKKQEKEEQEKEKQVKLLQEKKEQEKAEQARLLQEQKLQKEQEKQEQARLREEMKFRKQAERDKVPKRTVGIMDQVGQTDDEEPMIPPTDDEGYAIVKKLFLQQSDTGRIIQVRRFPFEIGREGSGLTVDLSLTKVSRRHAVITEDEEGFMIRDISKHGTFLDGERIPKNEEVPLKNGMKLLLKEIEFIVKIDEN